MSATANNTQRNNGPLRAFRRGQTRFAVSADAVSAVVDWREPAPLPEAPDAIRGVVSVHGRMLTVLDLSRLPKNTITEELESPRELLVLRGDEQLALAADEVEGTIELNETLRANRASRSTTVFDYEGGELAVVDVKEVFQDAMQGRERRHRRF